ncbi:MAG: AraC family transcriptional regulator [Clostridia bacterium]|nr:AraC family transcriptional regulator [Clostridia bacterium]
MFKKLSDNFKRRSFLFKYISVMFVIMLIPTFFGYAVSEMSLQATIAEIKKENYKSTAHIQRSMDSSFTTIKQTAIDIASGESLAAYANAPSSYTGYDLTQESFFPHTAMMRNYVDGVIIYNEETGTIINDYMAIYSAENYLDWVLDLHGQDRDEFLRIINTPSFNKLYPAKNIKTYNQLINKPLVFHTQSYPFMGEHKGTVITIVDVEDMLYDFSDRISEDSCFYIVDENGQIIISTGNTQYIGNELFSAEEGYGESRINGEKVMYSVRDSTYGKFKYVFVENFNSINSAVAPVRTALTLYVILILIFGSLAIYYIGKKNTQPVRELSGMLGANKESDTDDEFENIQSAIRSILSEKARMEPLIAESGSALRKILISNILRGNFLSADQIEEACEKAEVSFLHDNFCVIYFNLIEIEQEDIPVIKYAISNIVTELFASVGEVFTDDFELHSMVGILNLENSTTEIELQILSQLSFIRNFFIDNFETVINIGVGNILSSAEQISVSYSQAKEAAEYCALTGSKEVFSYSNIKIADYRYAYPLEVEDKLNSAVINGDIELVRQLLDQVIDANASLSLDMSRCLFFDLTATALKIMSNKTINLSAVFGSANSPFEKLMECKNISELVDTIHAIFDKICSQITESHGAKKEKLKIAVTDYIKDNYSNPTMSLGTLADEFDMNYTYMSHFFKDYIGANFVDYISEIRVKKAAELLRTTDMQINDIATAVGYANATVLIKIFKKITKTTPGNYRKNSRG